MVYRINPSLHPPVGRESHGLRFLLRFINVLELYIMLKSAGPYLRVPLSAWDQRTRITLF